MRPKLFVDTNVMVDLLAHREPFYEAANACSPWQT